MKKQYHCENALVKMGTNALRKNWKGIAGGTALSGGMIGLDSVMNRGAIADASNLLDNNEMNLIGREDSRFRRNAATIAGGSAIAAGVGYGGIKLAQNISNTLLRKKWARSGCTGTPENRQAECQTFVKNIKLKKLNASKANCGNDDNCKKSIDNQINILMRQR